MPADEILAQPWETLLGKTKDEGTRLVLQQVVKQCIEKCGEELVDKLGECVKPWLESEDSTEFCKGVYAWSCIPTKKDVTDLIDRAQISGDDVKIALCTLVSETMQQDTRMDVANSMGPILLEWCKDPNLNILAATILSKCFTASPDFYPKCNATLLADILLKDAEGLEGLVHLTQIPQIADYVVDKIQPLLTSSGNRFALFSLLANLVQYPTPETEEEALRKMAKPDEQWINPQITVEADTVERARLRVQTLLRAGTMTLFKSIPSLSPAAKPMALKCLHSILGDQPTSRITRGLAVQQGLVPILLAQQDVYSKQMLCWIAVSVDPRHLPMLDMVEPLVSCLQKPGLLRFESALALTNFASLDPSTRAGQGVLEKLVKLQVPALARTMLESEIVLDQRAGMELLCNLAQDTSVGEYYAGEESLPDRVQWIVGLCTSSDVQTRLAAAGFLATMADTSAMAKHIAHLNAYPLFVQMCTDDNAGLQHRALVVLNSGVEHGVLSKDVAKEGFIHVANQCQDANVQQIAKDFLK